MCCSDNGAPEGFCSWMTCCSLCTMGPAGGDVMSGRLEWAGGVWNSDEEELLSKFVSLGVCSLIIITHWVGEDDLEVSSCVGVTDGE